MIMAVGLEVDTQRAVVVTGETGDMTATDGRDRQDIADVGMDTVVIEEEGMGIRIPRKMRTATDCRWPTDEWRTLQLTHFEH